jgi:P27 family predicted phage terminase small subunit
MAGRKPKPTELKILNDNPGKRPLNKNEAKPKKALLICPDYLAEDKIAFDEWNRIVPELYKLNLLTCIDQTALELYCSQYSIYREAIKAIREEGLTTRNIRDGFKALPEVAIAREAAKTIKSLCVEFGLTPSSRSRIILPGEEDPDEEFGDLLD